MAPSRRRPEKIISWLMLRALRVRSLVPYPVWSLSHTQERTWLALRWLGADSAKTTIAMQQRANIASERSELFRQGTRLFIHHFAGVKRGLLLYQHDQALFRRARVVTHPLGHDEQLAFGKSYRPHFHVDVQASFQHQEKLIFVVMAVPSDRAVNFGDLDVALVDVGDDVWRPKLAKGGGDFQRR